jgi:hypothetical protein
MIWDFFEAGAAFVLCVVVWSIVIRSITIACKTLKPQMSICPAKILLDQCGDNLNLNCSLMYHDMYMAIDVQEHHPMYSIHPGSGIIQPKAASLQPGKMYPP